MRWRVPHGIYIISLAVKLALTLASMSNVASAVDWDWDLDGTGEEGGGGRETGDNYCENYWENSSPKCWLALACAYR